MYSLRRPNEAQLQKIAMQSTRAPLSTPTDPLKEEPQHHWYQDKYRREILVAAPAEDVRSCVAQVIKGCEFFPSWMVAKRLDDLVIVGAQLFGVWGVFADRIIEEHNTGDAQRFDIGFTYATVEGHFETGVELFRATRNGDAAVVFEIQAISRTPNPLKKIISEGWVRDLQKKFGRDTPLQFEAALRRRLARP